MNPLLVTVGRILAGMLISLLTETFVRQALIVLLEKLVVKTESDIDDRLLKLAKEAWGVGPQLP